MNEQLEAEVRKLVPEDGDVIVITHPGRMPAEALQSVASSMHDLIDRIGKKVHCVVLADGAGIHVLKTSQLEAA